MNKRIAEHVEDVFAGVAPEPKVLEIKEELLTNLNEKYLDLLAAGQSEETAYASVISGIGDIHDLLRDYTSSGPYSSMERERRRNQKNILVSIGSAIVVLSLAVLLVFSYFGLESLGLALTIICWAVATGMVVYGVNLSKTSYEKHNNTFVEQYKEKQADDESTLSMKKAINSAFWPLIVVIYLALSFITRRWDITWIIFIIAAAVQQMIHWLLFAKSKEGGKYWHGMFWTAVVALYFIISFVFSAWAWSWLVFIAAVALQQIIVLLKIWRKRQ